MTDNKLPRRSVLAAMGTAPLAASTALAPAGIGHADSSRTDRIPEDLRPGGKLDRLVVRLAAEDKFSGTVLLRHRDRPVLSRSVGMADHQRSIPNGPDTISLASITKLFTGVAIAQLAQRNKVAYHEKLGAYLDGFPDEIADQVTVHQLLTHTSGMGDHMQLPGYEKAAATWTSVQQTWDGEPEFVRKTGLAFIPGSGWRYCNTGYHALGAIVAEVSGQSYYDYVRENIFTPAGMTSSDFYTKPQWRDGRRIAHPYAPQDSGKRVDVLEEDPHFVGSPAGGGVPMEFVKPCGVPDVGRRSCCGAWRTGRRSGVGRGR
ncbi:serine hydrolase domain-containing protein [Amycolatopsis anabasis]|uniref:serine hydrolase domain-containing protein n=1 Tax=Amycolatopsis anabasis TaxID=1840409 RepID=UPI001FE50B16|nr:serine hydrolase domain-containing protein [Amycolatopsis anabasis]